MHSLYKTKHAILLAIFILSLSWANGQDKTRAVQFHESDPRIVRGVRPEPDYTCVSRDKILSGTVRIRITDNYSDLLKDASIGTGPDGIIQFGIPSIDAMNRHTGVTRASRTFRIALRDTIHKARHLKWGLHLWYDLQIDENMDVLDVRNLFSHLEGVETAEVLVKATVADHGVAEQAAWVPDDSLFTMQWHYHNTGQTGGTAGCDIDLPEAWEMEKGDSGVIVAIMDQGVEYDHPDLQANMWEGIGYNFFGDTVLIEKCLHGTHVAGTISANTNNGFGVSGIAGGDGSGNGVRIMSCQIISGMNTVIEANIPNAFIWAADRGAAISQNSWNFPTASPSLFEAIDYFIANGGGSALNGGILVCSAGNSDTNGISYPACYEPCLAVASTSHQDIRSFFSNYGPWVDLCAPGGNHYPFNEEDILSTVPEGGYGYLMGTSMACPHVSGVAALIISHAKGVLTPEDVKDILLYSTDDISSLNPDYSGWLGTGRLNARKALLMTRQYLDPGIPKPVRSISSVSGDAGSVDLEWIPNETGDTALLAFNHTGSFGIPAGQYNPGDSIPGGGKVIYKGKMTAYTHMGIDSGTVCHYSIWSVRNSVYSLIGRRTNDTVHSSPHGIDSRVNAHDMMLRVVPNPTDGFSTLFCRVTKPSVATISVYDAEKRMVRCFDHWFSQAGVQTVTVYLSGLPAGLYYLQVKAEDTFAGVKIIVAK